MDAGFWELHSGLAHEAPGSRADSLRALALTGLCGRLRVLDIGCGPGAASLALVEALPEAEVTAVDLHAPFIEAARARVARAGHADRFRTVQADMAELPFPAGSFDLLWCEGAAYILGTTAALEAWRPLLAPGGRLAFTDAVWLTERPHPRARRFWTEYPAMTGIDGVRGRIAGAGWRPIADFVLAETAWSNYYAPLADRLERLEAERGPDAPALSATREEIAIRRDHAADYGYAFFVAAP